ncbi:MAG: glycosyltransferase [Lachnospiraceae bacterium]|nr:glycosyltransferase [Lachnospiraceae bacterium]
MSVSKDKCISAYKKELFKQTMPYGYEIVYGTKIPAASAPNASGAIVLFPDDGANVLNFDGITEEYVVFVHRDGVYEPDLIERLIGSADGADIIYCDEDFTEDVNADLSDINVRIRTLRTPWRKPEYSPDTIVSFPYIETCFAIKTSFARSVLAIKQSPEIGDSVRCYDFLLRAMERARSIVHTPQILYHRDLRKLIEKEGEVSDNEIFAALYEKYQRPGYVLCREAAENRRGINVIPEATVKGRGKDKEKECVVSIIIPSKDQPRVLKECIRNIRLNAGNVPYEIIVVDNGSNEENRDIAEKYVTQLPGGRGTYIYEPMEFNFSMMCNTGADRAKGSFLLFMNDDVDAISDSFLERLLIYANRSYVGAVGAKLLFPDDRSIQHIGVTEIDRGPTHKLAGADDRKVHYYCRNRFAWNVLAVTGACLMVSREKYYQTGGFCDRIKVGYNDVELCVRLFEAGYYNVVDNDCVMTHHESLARGTDAMSDLKSERLSTERDLLYSMHPWLMQHTDPFYGYMLDRDTVNIGCGIVPDYQVTDFRNKVKVTNKPPGRESKKVMMSIDRCGIERGIAENAGDAYTIEGWGISLSWDNALVRKFIVLIPLDDDGAETNEYIIAATSPKYREDVAETFPDAVNVSLAGFVCAIPFDAIDENRRYRIGVMLRKKTGLKSCRAALGDIYEPRRGIVKDE